MGNIANVKIGPMSVSFNGTDIGHTQEGSEIVYTPDWHEILVDQYGSSVADMYLRGERLLVRLRMAEYSVDRLAEAMPAGTKAGVTDGRLTIGKDAGDRASDSAAELVLHPIDLDSDDLSEDIVLHSALVINEISVPGKTDEEKSFVVEFLALVDETKSSGNYLGHFGDSTD